MRNPLWFLFLASLLLAPGFSLAEPRAASELMGQQIPNFSLPAQEGRLVQYETDYYGKYNLILTFFPAAFTPV